MPIKRLLAAALLLAAGCDQSSPSSSGIPPPKDSQRELAELQTALEAQALAAVTNQVATNVAATNSVATNAAVAKAGVPAAERPRPAPAVTGFASEELDEIRVELNQMPDLGLLSSYVKIEPDPGPLVTGWMGWRRSCRIHADFQPRTKYSLLIRQGCPMADGRVLAHEFRRTWTTGDRRAKVRFASDGRYLPSGGMRAVEVKSVNVTNLACEIRSVPSDNIVQLLAREEGRYDRYYGSSADSTDTEELAANPKKRRLRPTLRPNEEVSTLLEVRDGEGRAANGVYLLQARNDDRVGGGRCHKLVCVTDIGLSVRKAGDSVYVWATSLMSGRPVGELRVRVYGANRIVLGEELSDADGWCCCELEAKSEPFAVVAERMDGSDVSFLALGQALEEIPGGDGRREYVAKDGCEAFVWTDRGIYRHGERILVHALLRNGEGNAPKPFPVTVEMFDPDGNRAQERTVVADGFGSVVVDGFTVADGQKSGGWEIRVRIPGEGGRVLGEREIRIEEFVPPQIRVKVTPPDGDRATTGMVFTVAGEHLFGGPARGLPAEAAVRFEDAPFAPLGWEAFRFGDVRRGLKPNFEKLDVVQLDGDGKARFSMDFPKTELPRAAVKMTVQGSVFESGGRPASARTSKVLHRYPFYIGVALPESLRESTSPHVCRVAMVEPDGTPHRGTRRLRARFERVERVFGLRQSANGCWEWKSDEVRMPIGGEFDVVVAANGSARLPVPVSVCGDCAVTLTDEESGVSFGAQYWVGGAEDAAVRATLENPSRVTMKADRAVYYPGERPRIQVKAPFAGSAWLGVLRDGMLYSQVIVLTNATSEVELEPVTEKWAPGVDVVLSVVQSVATGRKFSANRAFGLQPLRVATRDSALKVKVAATVKCAPSGGSEVLVSVDARGEAAVGERAVVTVVDEGIHLLTDEKVPDPVAWFGEPRDGAHPLYDIYYRLLPVFDERLKRAGAKTGGGAEGDLFRRISPVPSRRFRPLSVWKFDVPLVDGRAEVPFTLPEFVGEVRVTAVAYGRRATGAGAVQAKVTPRLVMQADAPRFAAPGDRFLATVTLSNRSGREGTVVYDLMAGGAVELERPVHGELKLADGASETLTFPVRAGQGAGQGSLVFVSEGLDEKHKTEIELPVRPAVPWRRTVEVFCLHSGERKKVANPSATLPSTARRVFMVSGSPVAELASALEYLVGYPYGCLEQTVSRVFPLMAAGGILNTLPVSETSVADDAKSVVDEGIQRICTMVHARGFSMWPDSYVQPWDGEVSLWAAHFLVAAERNQRSVPKEKLEQVKAYLRGRAMSTNAVESVYACQVLALAGAADQDRMQYWFDARSSLGALDRSRLAGAFARVGDRVRARELMDGLSPDSVKAAAFALLAWLEIDPKDAALPPLVAYLLERRDAAGGHWLTTEGNAHALLALGAWHRMNPVSTEKPVVVLCQAGSEERLEVGKRRVLQGCGEVEIVNRGAGEAFMNVSCLSLPEAVSVVEETRGIAVARRYLRTDGKEAALDSLVRGEMLIAEVTLTAPAKTMYSDLVLEELLPACFEPDATKVSSADFPWLEAAVDGWELRREFRDDRVLGFSRRFTLDAGQTVKFRYAVRVVGAGDFTLPGSYVEAMYAPELHARAAASSIRITR